MKCTSGIFRAIRLVIGLVATTGIILPVQAQDRRDFYVLGSSEPGSWWKTEARALVNWNGDEPVMTGLECVIMHDRYLEDGKPPMEIAVSHPTESGEYRFRFQFNLAEGKLINRKVETITVGGRPYRLESVQSRIVPWVGGQTGIILTYGIGREMFRPNETYPWLPIEFLIPQFFEVEGITLGLSGDFEIEHGEYERRYEDLYIDMDGFKESMDWCYRHVNPTHERELELSSKLKKQMER